MSAIPTGTGAPTGPNDDGEELDTMSNYDDLLSNAPKAGDTSAVAAGPWFAKADKYVNGDFGQRYRIMHAGGTYLRHLKNEVYGDGRSVAGRERLKAGGLTWSDYIRDHYPISVRTADRWIDIAEFTDPVSPPSDWSDLMDRIREAKHGPDETTKAQCPNETDDRADDNEDQTDPYETEPEERSKPVALGSAVRAVTTAIGKQLEALRVYDVNSSPNSPVNEAGQILAFVKTALKNGDDICHFVEVLVEWLNRLAKTNAEELKGLEGYIATASKKLREVRNELEAVNLVPVEDAA